MGMAQAAEGKIKLGSGDKELRSFGSGGGYDSLSRLALARTRNLVHYEANFFTFFSFDNLMRRNASTAEMDWFFFPCRWSMGPNGRR